MEAECGPFLKRELRRVVTPAVEAHVDRRGGDSSAAMEALTASIQGPPGLGNAQSGSGQVLRSSGAILVPGLRSPGLLGEVGSQFGRVSDAAGTGGRCSPWRSTPQPPRRAASCRLPADGHGNGIAANSGVF